VPVQAVKDGSSNWEVVTPDAELDNVLFEVRRLNVFLFHFFSSSSWFNKFPLIFLVLFDCSID
jgi:hypothetical protein